MGFSCCCMLNDMSSAGVVIFASLLGIPMTWLCNYFDESMDPVIILSMGLLCLLTVIYVVFISLGELEKRDPLYYVFAICCFSSVVDLLLALENDRYISGFLHFYLKNGEPYLKTAFGTMICYWDGTFHYALYICMLVRMASGQTIHNLGLLWSGSIINSMIVLMLGNILGSHEVKPSILLNVPFIFVPIYALLRFLHDSKRYRSLLKSRQATEYVKDISPLDLLTTLLCGLSLLMFVLTGMASLNWKKDNFLSEFSNKIIPYLKDPVFYPKIQHITYLFYFVPYYGIAMYGLLKSNYTWMNDWAYFFLGAILQGQFSFVGASFHLSTAAKYRPSQDPNQLSIFWLVNFTPVLVHVILVYRSLMSEQDIHNGVKIYSKEQ